MNRLRWWRAGGLLVALSVSLAAPKATGTRPSESVEGRRPTDYHVRLVHARWQDGASGAALFKPTALVVPLAERELWGDPVQLEALRSALGAETLEPVPGLVVRESPSMEAEPSRFRTNLGEQVLEISFLGTPRPEGWHRVTLSAFGDRGTELLDASVLVQSGQTVALVAPTGDPDEAVIIGVTPMGGNPVAEADVRARTRPVAVGDAIHMVGRDGVTFPRLIEESKVLPVYPASARAAGLSGQVILEVVVRIDGTVDGIVVLNMPQGGEWLAGAAVEAIRQWRYEPATLNEEPVNAYFTVVTEFHLK